MPATQLLDDSGSESEAGGVALNGGDFKVNQDFARRFDYNKKREELRRRELTCTVLVRQLDADSVFQLKTNMEPHSESANDRTTTTNRGVPPTDPRLSPKMKMTRVLLQQKLLTQK